jgi:hypothetical protein
MVILPGITRLWTRNPTEEWLFHWELPAHGQEIHPKHIFPPGITKSFTRNPPEERLFYRELLR